MESSKFINNYDYYLSEISSVVKPELLPILVELKEIDPKDLVLPEAYFESEHNARGFVWSIFIGKALYNSNFHQA